MPIVKTLKYKIAGVVIVMGVLGYAAFYLYSNSVGVLVSNAQTCLDAGDLNCARENLNRVLDKNPNHLDALFMLAKIDFQTGNHQTLEPVLRKVLGIQPDLTEARQMLATLLLSKCRFDDTEKELADLRQAGAFSSKQQGQLALVKAGQMVSATQPLTLIDEVSTNIEGALSGDANQPDAHLANAILQIQMGDGAEALTEAQLAQQAMGENFMTQWAIGRARFIQEDLANAQIAFERADTLRRSDRNLRPPGAWVRELFLNQGLVLIEQGRLEEAQRTLDIAIENDPTAVRPALALVNLFLIQAGVGSGSIISQENSQRFYKRAIDELKQKPELLQSDPVYRYQLALIQIYIRGFQEAMDILEALTQEDPPYLQAFQELGNLKNNQANYRGAAEAFKAVVEKNKQDLVAAYNYGTLMVRIQEIEEAREFLRQVVAGKPSWLQARLNLALSYRMSGMYADASAAYQRILDQSANNMNALIGLGLVAFTQGDLETARENFERARENHPERSQPYFYLGQVELEVGRTAEAQSMFEKCLSIEPENEFAILSLVEIQFRKGSWEQAKEPLNLILENPNARLTVIAQNALALVSLMTGDEEEAQASLERLSENASDVEPYLKSAIETNQALLQLRKKEYDKAIDRAQQIVNLIPNDADSYYNLGTFQLEAGRYSEALLSLRRAIELDPNHVDAQFNLAVAQSALNRWDDTLSILSRLGKVGDAPLELIQSLADAYLGADDPQAALDILEPAIENRGGNVQLQTLRVKALIGVGKSAEAARLSQDLIATYPQDADVQCARGMAAFLSGDVKGGETSMRRALQIRTEDPNLKLNLATLLIAKGDYDEFEEAEKLLDEVQKQNLFLEEVANQRAFLAARRSDYETARVYLKRSLQKNSKQPKIETLLNQWEGL